ncbi:MAG: hypothetical protein AB7O52_03995 [Planctomycetota bacterium]
MENPYQSSESEWSAAPPSQEENASDDLVEVLAQTRPWTLVCATLSLLAGVLSALLGVGMILVALVAPEAFEAPDVNTPDPFGGMPPLLFGVVYLLLGAVYMVPGILLYRYAGRIRKLTREPSHHNMLSTLKSQRTFWRVVGVSLLAMTAVFLLIMLVAAIAVMLSQM